MSRCPVNNYDELVVIFYSQFKTSVLINFHTNTNYRVQFGNKNCVTWWTFKSLVEVSILLLFLPRYQWLLASLITCTRGGHGAPFSQKLQKVVSYPSARIYISYYINPCLQLSFSALLYTFS